MPPVFATGGWLGADHARFITEVLDRAGREPNFWDGALILPTSKYALLIFVAGFVLVVGDLYVRDIQEGTVPLTLLRSRSRHSWWAGKILSIAPPAALYSALAYLSALAARALRLPVSMAPSPAARIPWGKETALYPRIEGLPMPLFFVLVVLYTAFALWAIGSAVIAASALYPRVVVPLAAGLAWLAVGSRLEEPFFYWQGPMLLNPVYHATYVAHFDVGGDLGAAPWLYAAAVLGGTLCLALAIGAWRVRHVDL